MKNINNDTVSKKLRVRPYLPHTPALGKDTVEPPFNNPPVEILHHKHFFQRSQIILIDNLGNAKTVSAYVYATALVCWVKL